MSIIYKTPVSEEQQKAVVTAQQNKIVFDELRAAIKSESNTRSNDDIEINRNISALRGVVTEEINARASETAILTADLATEINQRETAVFNLRNDLNAEILARETSESNIQDEFNTKIDAEKTARSQAISDMQAAILAAMGNDKAAESIENDKLREQIEAEAANQAAGLKAISDKLTTEEGTRAAEDTKISNAIADETAARKNADLQLQNTLNTAISTEKNARIACDTALSTAINNAVNTLADLIDDETIARNAADSDLTVAINNTKSTLENKIAAENSARQSAVTQLQTNLTNAINTEIQARNRAIDSATQITKTYVDQQVAAVEDNLNVFTAPTKTAQGKQGLVPAPPAEPEGGIKILTDYGWRAPNDATLTISVVPTQTGSLTYSTNTTQTPTWANFDEKKLKIEGELSGVDAKTYTVRFTPLDIYMWADTLDQTPKTATWKIDPRILVKPSAAVTEFTFNHNAQGLTVSNFDSVYESQTGTISATDANSYTATYKLRSPANTRWSDNSVNDVVINWKIIPLKLEKPSASVTEFTYNRAAQGITVSNFIALDISETGVTSATDANSYSAVYKLKSKINTTWADSTTGDVTINWKIKPLLLTKPSASVTEFTYDRTAKNLSVANFDSIYESQTGTISATTVNSYTATYSLKNTNNTKWTDNSTAPVNISWKIKPLQLPKPSAAVTEFDCDENVKNLEVANLNSIYITKKSGTTSESEPGEYSVVYSLIDTANTQWTDSSVTDVTINWKINLRVLTVEQSSGFAQIGTLTYNGQNQPVTVKNFDDKYHVLGSETAKVDAGTYTATITPRVGCVWNDMTKTPKTITWKIQPQTLAIPYADTIIFVYDGAAKTLQVKNYDPATMNQDGTVSESAAGEYSVTYSLKSKTNYIWADSSTTDKKIDWQIGSKELPKPTCSTTQFTYSGDRKTITILNVDLDYMTETGTKSEVNAGEYKVTYHLKNTLQAKWADGSTNDIVINWKIDRKKLTATQSNVYKTGDFTYNTQMQYIKDKLANFDENYHDLTGATYWDVVYDYTAYVAPKPNYAWSDGTFEKKTINWRINILKLKKPSVVGDTVFTWDDTYKGPVIVDYDSTYMHRDGVINDNRVGDHQIIFKLYYPANTTWLDNSTDDVVINWRIDRQKIPADNSTFAQDAVLTYSGSRFNISDHLTGYNSAYHDLSSDITKTDAGTYTVGITPKSTYAFSDGSTDTKYLQWTIQPFSVNMPVADNVDFVYDGKSHAPVITGFNSSYMTRSGDYGNKSALGNYKITYTLKNTTNTRWSDGSVAPYVINWSIGLTKVEFPYFSENEFTYDGNEHSPVFANFDSETMVIKDDGNSILRYTDADTWYYSVYVELKDKTKYAWENGENGAYVLYWWIHPKPLSAAQSTGFAQSGTLNYNGKNQTVNITNFDANYHQLSGQYIAKDGGTYVAKIVPRSNYCWNNGSRTAIPVVWTIDPLKLVKPSASGTTDFEYDKQAHSLSVQNFNDTYMTQKGDATTQTNTGFYTTVYSLKSTANTTWDDDSVADVPVSWSISKKQIPKPILSKNHSYQESPYREQYNYYSSIIGIANYDGTYMSFTTTVPENFLGSSSNGYDMAYGAVGTYTITYHLTSDLVVWEGGDTADFTLTVIVTPAPLTAEQSNPYQSTIPTYTGGNINIVSENYIKGYYVRSGVGGQVWSGETSASTVGEHTAYVEPDQNHTWQDGTRTKKTFKWRIDPAPIDKPTLDSSVTLTYDGNSKSPTLSGYDSAKMTLGGDVSAINAGIYTITATPTANYCWAEDGSRDPVEIEWQIDYLVLTKPNVGSYDWTNDSLDSDNYFDGNQNFYISSYFSGTTQYPFGPNASVLPSALKNYDSDTMTIGGTLGASDTGTYKITFTPKNANHSFNAKRKESATLFWTIRPKVINVPTLKSNGILSYTGEAQSPFNSTINANLINITGDATGTAKKSYSTTLALKYPAHSTWKLSDNTKTAENQSYRWSIGVTSVGSTPSLAQDYFDYGGTKTVTINGFDSATMTKTGTESASKRGFYTITFKLKDTTGTCWSTGGSADIVKEWAIGTKKIAKPTLAENATTEFTYSGSAKTLSIEGYDANTMNMTGYLSATDAGSYTVSFTPRTDTGVTYVWQDSTSAAVTFTWKINRKPITKLVFYGVAELTYKGEPITATVSAGMGSTFDASTMNISSDVTKTNVGSYTAQISPKSNYCWDDQTVTAVAFKWKIVPKRISIPTATKTVYEHTGEEITLEVSNFNTDFVELVSTSKMKATASGSYTATFKLKDSANTCWTDKTTANKSISWSIGAAYYEIPTISPITQQFALPTVTYSVTPSDYDSNAISATGLSKTFVHTDFNTSTNKATVSATFTLVNYPNAKWADGQTGATRTVTWTVEAFPIAPGHWVSFSESSAYLGAKFDGNTHFWHELNHTSDDITTKDYFHNVTSASTPSYFKTISGTKSEVNAGEYTVSLTPANWCYWSTGGRAAKTIKWAIEKAFYPIVLSQDSVTLNDDNLSATVDFTTKSTGAVTVTSNDTSIATVSYNSSTKVITINAGLSGTTSILVNQAADTNYYASAAKTITVTVSRSLNSLSWAQISNLAKNGTLSSQYRVGSCKVTPYFEATIGNAQISVWALLYSFLIGIDHNSGIEGSGRAHFMNIIKMPNDTKERIFIESGYGSTSLDNYFNIYGTTASEAFPTTSSYNFSKIRSVCNQFLNALPAELQNVIVACKKFSHVNVSRYTDHTPYSSTTDKIWIPSMREITGQSTGNSYVDARVKQYDYFANGNSRTFYGFNSISKANYWTRDQVDTDNNPNDTPYPADCYYIDVNGNPALAQGKYSYGFLPCFTIGGE